MNLQRQTAIWVGGIIVSALMLWLAFGAMVYVNVAHMTWMPTYLHEKFKLTLANASFSSMSRSPYRMV